MTVATEGGMQWHGRTLKMALARCFLLLPTARMLSSYWRLLRGGWRDVPDRMAEGGEGGGGNGGVGCGGAGLS